MPRISSLKRAQFIAITLFSVALIYSSCEILENENLPDDQRMNNPTEGLSNAQMELFNLGADEFDEIYTKASGLGPIFVSNSCGSCHAQDNRGPEFNILTRFGQSDTFENPFIGKNGPQIQPFGFGGITPEKLPSGVVSSKFIAPIVAGIGFLEAIADSTLLRISDPTDLNQDGISGRPNFNTIPSWVTPNSMAVNRQNKFICRFGRKASIHNLFQQTATAFHEDMGITSVYFPQNIINKEDGSTNVPIENPEVSEADIHAAVFYLQALQTPPRRNSNHSDVLEGQKIFQQIGCGKCHIETVKTGYSPIEVLSDKTIHPYTDLLLHDMGSELNDGYTEGTALPEEWRTPPLWGLGLASKSQGGKLFLLHDGRAKSIEQAISFHGGEASSIRNNFNALSNSDKQKLIRFLNSL